MKGHKTGGRQAGTPNKVTKELREALKNILHDEIERIPEHLETLPPGERLQVLTKLIPYALPKVQPVNHQEGEPWTFD
jgi:hypothetical protein